jgi:hypothetical protein
MQTLPRKRTVDSASRLPWLSGAPPGSPHIGDADRRTGGVHQSGYLYHMTDGPIVQTLTATMATSMDIRPDFGDAANLKRLERSVLVKLDTRVLPALAILWLMNLCVVLQAVQ